VLSTIHAGSAPRVFARLAEMGVEPFVLTSAVRGVLAQRLLRRRCADCGGNGCDPCGSTGYRGRALVAEWLDVSPSLKKAILARSDADALAAAAQADGLRTLRDEAESLAEAGVTTDEEVARVLGND
jgi:general secretion pathway protein E